MNIGCKRTRAAEAGFNLVEVCMGVGVLGIAAVSLFAALGSGFSLVQIDRENLRATQVLEEKMEVIRLINWDQINQPGFVPSTFTAPFYPAAGTNTAGGITFTGTVLVTNAPISETYSGDLRMVRVTVTWTSEGVQHQRQMTTFVCQYGLQKYIY